MITFARVKCISVFSTFYHKVTSVIRSAKQDKVWLLLARGMSQYESRSLNVHGINEMSRDFVQNYGLRKLESPAAHLGAPTSDCWRTVSRSLPPFRGLLRSLSCSCCGNWRVQPSNQGRLRPTFSQTSRTEADQELLSLNENRSWSFPLAGQP